MNRNDFNDKQLEAIDVSINKNVLVSAAAGSGKTKTLSTKVFEIINNKEIRPSELLVLTFTKNAAYEMKTRIINTFKENKKYDLATEMKSCHIQTFDSFSLELVSKYAGALGIADTISLIDDSIIRSKRSLIIDEVLDYYYKNEKERMVNTLKKFNTRDDEKTKSMIVDIDDKLDKMTIIDRNNFINIYEEMFLSKEKFAKFYEDYINYYKKILIKYLLNAYITIKSEGLLNLNVTKSTSIDYQTVEKIKTYLENEDIFKVDYRKLYFDDDACDTVYKLYLELIESNPLLFPQKVIEVSKNEVFISKIKNKLHKAAFDILKSLFVYKNKEALLLPKVFEVYDLNTLYEEYYSFKDDISLMLEIIKKIDEKVFDYKKISGNYTYNDISKFTNDLLTNEKYYDIQEALRNQYKYIMVDEYQDSNDYQESLIDSLISLCKSGKQSHLFCVGDVKQSIYAFRNSNVELFRNRQTLYSNDNTDNIVINMNYNYRSGEGLINDINYLFSNYMRLDNGGIDYTLNGEKLHYDKDKNVYSKKYDNFKIERILPRFEGGKEFEANAIVSDIKNKIENKYLVYDKKEGIRPCRYSDFAIIARTKNGFTMYQKLFYENNIPLNIILKDELTNIDAVIMLQSLFNLINVRMNNDENGDIMHLFASVARSYIYEYSDDSLHKILVDKSMKSLYDDKIMKDVDSFIKKNKDNEFDIIFLNAINHFKVIEKLNLIGNVIDNVNKIESLYNLVLNEINNGEGLNEFIELFKTLSKNNLKINTETNIENSNAVDMMTIHASKGLERKIVYLPTYYNKSPNKSDGTDYIFSKKLGIILPNYLKEGEPTTILNSFYDVLSKESKVESDEFVRLLYVAFTRAENTCYIVGNETSGLYEVYDGLPYYYEIDNEILDKHNSIIGVDLIDKYYNSIKYISDSCNIGRISIDSLDENQINIYNYMFNKYFTNIVNYHNNTVGLIMDRLGNYYIDYINNSPDIITYICKIYGLFTGYNDINDLDDLTVKLYGELNDINRVKTHEKALLFYNGLEAKPNSQVNLRYLSYVVDSPKYLVECNFSFYGFKDNKRYIDIDNLSKNDNIPNIDLSNYAIDNEEIKFDKLISSRASIKLSTDEEKEIREKLDYGTYLHHLLELIDFKTKDTSYIKDIKAKELIDKTLKLEVFDDLDKASVYKEYEYYDNLYDTVGSIDLLYIKDGIYYIIDYKSSDIDKEGYINQLHTYQRNVMEKFNIDSSKIRLYLVSISKQSFIEVNAYKE